MAVISINIPDEDLPKVVEALCNGDNPTGVKAKARVIELVKREVIRYYSRKAEADNATSLNDALTARDTAIVTARTSSEAINIT